MTFQTTMLLLRLLHVLAGIFWAGAAVMFAGFVYPAARASGPAGGRVIQELMQHRKLGLFFTLSAAITILSGITMYSLIGFGSYDSWMRSPMGFTLGIGAAAAIVAATLGVSVAAPASKHAAMLGVQTAASGVPPADHVAELARVHTRLRRASTASAMLLVISASAMAMARYV